MNPPLRAESDRAAMIEGLLDGTIDAIATDHAPHAAHEKEQEFDRAPNGITGLETALGLAIRILHLEHKMPLAKVLALLTTRPAQALGLKGREVVAVGLPPTSSSSILRQKWTFHAAELKIQIEEHPVRRLGTERPHPCNDLRRPGRESTLAPRRMNAASYFSVGVALILVAWEWRVRIPRQQWGVSLIVTTISCVWMCLLLAWGSVRT